MRLHSILFGFIVLFSPVLLAQEADTLLPTSESSSAVPTATPAAPLTTTQRAMLSAIRGRDAGTLERMREDMAAELRDVSRHLSQIDPRDARFAESLKSEQSNLIEQIKAIDAQMKTVANPAAPTGFPEPAFSPNELMPPGDIGTRMPVIPPGKSLDNPLTPQGIRTSDDLLRQQTTETIKNLRALGLNDLADQEQRRLDAMSNQLPNQPSSQFLPPASSTIPSTRPMLPRDETPTIMPGGFSPATTRPAWTTPGTPEVAELKETIASLQTQIEQMRQDMKAIETQLRLLNQNILLKGTDN